MLGSLHLGQQQPNFQEGKEKRTMCVWRKVWQRYFGVGTRSTFLSGCWEKLLIWVWLLISLGSHSVWHADAVYIPIRALAVLLDRTLLLLSRNTFNDLQSLFFTIELVYKRKEWLHRMIWEKRKSQGWTQLEILRINETLFMCPSDKTSILGGCQHG